MQHRFSSAALVAAFVLSACSGAGTTVPGAANPSAKAPVGRAKPHSVVPGCNSSAPVGTVTECSIPFSGTAAQPLNITVDPNGTVWFTDYGRGSVGSLTPPTQVWNEYATSSKTSEPYGITTSGDGNVWFTEYHAAKLGEIKLGSGLPSLSEIAFPVDGTAMTSTPNYMYAIDDGSWVRISNTGSTYQYTNPNSGGIAADASGNLFATAIAGVYAHQIIEERTTGQYPHWAIPTAGAEGRGITRAPSGTAMWFVEYNTNKVASIDNGVITEYTIPTASSEPANIVAACGNLWFTEESGNKIGEITPAGAITEYPVPTAGAEPYGITADFDGNVWFTEFGASKIGIIVTSCG